MKTTLLPHGGGPDRCSPVLLKRGTGVGYSVYHMHRRRDLYGDDAADFRPERWDENDLANTIGWGFMPFHGGPRICLGSESFFLLLSSLQFFSLTYFLNCGRGFCAHGSLLRNHSHSADVSESEIAAG